MAAWLAYLKSRLLLPQPPDPDEPRGEEMAAALAHQCCRLEAMQQAGARLMARPQLWAATCSRAARPEGLPRVLIPVYEATLYDLLKAYGERRQRKEGAVLHIGAPELYSMDDALQRLGRMLGRMPEWRRLVSFLPPGSAHGLVRALGHRRDLRRDPRAGALRQAGAAPGRAFRSDLSAQPATRAHEPQIDTDDDDAAIDRAQHLRLLEALLFASAAPLDDERSRERLPEGADVAGAASPSSRRSIAPRGVNLVHVAGGWTFRTAPDLAPRLRLEQKSCAQIVARRRSRRWRSSPITSR